MGELVGDEAFLSTTTSIDAMKSQQFYQMPPSIVVYELQSERGSILPFQPFTQVSEPQREVLLPRGSQFQIQGFAHITEPDGRGGVRKVTYVLVSDQGGITGSVAQMSSGQPGVNASQSLLLE